MAEKKADRPACSEGDSGKDSGAPGRGEGNKDKKLLTLIKISLWAVRLTLIRAGSVWNRCEQEVKWSRRVKVGEIGENNNS